MQSAVLRFFLFPLLAGCSIAPADGADLSAPLTDLGPPQPDCASLIACNCVDGASMWLSGCGTESCAQLCAGHGGVEPSGTCPAGETPCSGLCTRPSAFEADPSNCGGCHIVCVEYERCVGGTCTVDLPDGSFACRSDSDCGAGESCVLNPAANCPAGPFCARTCPATCTDGSCAAAIDVGSNASISACIAANLCS